MKIKTKAITNMKNTLHLNLKRQWYDMILSGEKKEEYREITDYWRNRLITPRYYVDGEEWFEFLENLQSKRFIDTLDELLKAYNFSLRNYDTITFSNGYAKNRPQFEIELKGIEIKEGNPEWGAEKGVKYFVLKLGKVL